MEYYQNIDILLEEDIELEDEVASLIDVVYYFKSTSKKDKFLLGKAGGYTTETYRNNWTVHADGNLLYSGMAYEYDFRVSGANVQYIQYPVQVTGGYSAHWTSVLGSQLAWDTKDEIRIPQYRTTPPGEIINYNTIEIKKNLPIYNQISPGGSYISTTYPPYERIFYDLPALTPAAWLSKSIVKLTDNANKFNKYRIRLYGRVLRNVELVNSTVVTYPTIREVYVPISGNYQRTVQEKSTSSYIRYYGDSSQINLIVFIYFQNKIIYEYHKSYKS